MLIIASIVLPLTILLVVMVIFLIDKVRRIEEIANNLINSISRGTGGNSEKNLDPSFMGLSGKPLWDALVGTNLPAEINPDELDNVRQRFATLLERHARLTFKSGYGDAEQGKPRKVPKNEQNYPTLRGEVNIWAPSQQIASLYNSGFDLKNASDADAERIEAKVQEIMYGLFGSVSLAPPDSLIDEIFGTSN